jgi:hypothetical protein
MQLYQNLTDNKQFKTQQIERSSYSSWSLWWWTRRCNAAESAKVQQQRAQLQAQLLNQGFQQAQAAAAQDLAARQGLGQYQQSTRSSRSTSNKLY